MNDSPGRPARLHLNTSALQKAESRKHYSLHRAALEWSLAQPIIINSADDIQSRVDWKGRLEPYHHQVQNLMRFCRRLPVTLLADDVGLGKTISAGLIVSELMKRGRVAKTFVVCPKLLIPQWIEELDAKFGIQAHKAIGADLNNAANSKESVTVTTYQSATRFLEQGPPEAYDLLILDEAHKVRNLHGSQSPPKMAKVLFRTLESRAFKYVVMLTATPIQNRLWDIYSLIDCLAVARGHANPFGPPDNFAARFIADGKQTARRLVDRQQDEFRRIVGSYMFRTRRIDAKLVFPDREVQTYAVTPKPVEVSLQQLIAGQLSGLNALAQTSVLVALMSSPQALSSQLNNMAQKGTIPSAAARQAEAALERVAVPAKAEAVIRIARDLSGQRDDWRMVVFTTRKETQKMLGQALEAEGIAHGFISGNSSTQNSRTIADFRSSPPKVHVIVSTDAGAEGVNLQAANILVNYDLPWNPMVVEQRIGRVQRIGSHFKTVWVANIVHENSPEQRIVARLLEKLQVISHTVGDIEAVLEASDDSDGTSLEKQIREMVVESLQGQDQEMAAKKAEESIEQARKLIEESQEEMDRTLGGGDDGEEEDVPMPKLEVTPPSIPAEEFVLDALRLEGAEIEDLGDGLWLAESNSLGAERFTFTEDVVRRFTQPGAFMGLVPALYQPGKPAFERLVQRWVDSSAVHIEDDRSTANDLQRAAGSWVSTVPDASLKQFRDLNSGASFSGRLVFRVRVANGVDSFEKLIDLELDTPQSASYDPSGLTSARSLLPDIDHRIEAAVTVDADIATFKNYYEKRLQKELASSDSGDREKRLRSDLSPQVFVDSVAIEGKLVGEQEVRIRYSLNGDGDYESVISVEGNHVVREPNRGVCEVTGMKFPVDCLETCCVTGSQALRGKLAVSEETGEYALPDTMVTCESSGKRVHRGEIAVCAVSGKAVISSLLVGSELSGRRVLPEFLKRCEITDSRVLEEELKVSDLSGKRFRSDEAVILADGHTVGHASEASQCSYSGRWHDKTQCAPSEVSGRLAHQDRLRQSDKTGRWGDTTETLVCAATGRTLLSDEAAACAISGGQVDKDLLSKCAETGEMAQTTLMAVCGESGMKVLPATLHECAATGMSARRSLLRQSDASGRLCLQNRMVTCAVSGAILLPDEAAPCSLTGRLADLRLQVERADSGTLALKTELLQSTLTGEWWPPDQTVPLPDGGVAGEQEVALCWWTDRYERRSQTGRCALCGRALASSLLNSDGEFALLRDCLDGSQKGKPFPEPGYLARVHPDKLGAVQKFNWVSSPSGNAHIFFGSVSTLVFFNKTDFACFAEGNLQGFKVKGPLLIGQRNGGVWSPK